VGQGHAHNSSLICRFRGKFATKKLKNAQIKTEKLQKIFLDENRLFTKNVY